MNVKAEDVRAQRKSADRNSFFFHPRFKILQTTVRVVTCTVFPFQHAVWLGWIVSTLLMPGTMFSAWWFYKPNYEYDAIVAALYGALYRTTWAAGVSWTIIAVSTGNGGNIIIITLGKIVLYLFYDSGKWFYLRLGYQVLVFNRISFVNIDPKPVRKPTNSRKCKV